MTAVSWAMPSARATHAPHRAVLHRLGLSVGIAIAVAGCSREAFEADPIMYSTVAGYAEMDFGHASVLARNALADGFLSRSEYHAVVVASDEQREAEYRLIRDRVIAKGRAQ